jgi:hypothetical protein
MGKSMGSEVIVEYLFASGCKLAVLPIERLNPSGHAATGDALLQPQCWMLASHNFRRSRLPVQRGAIPWPVAGTGRYPP